MWSNNHFDRYFIGLDRIAERMSTLAQETQKAVSNYPPYNLKKIMTTSMSLRWPLLDSLSTTSRLSWLMIS